MSLRLLEKLDVQRLSGIKRILGVELGSKTIRVEKIKKNGNFVNKYRGNFSAVHSFSIDREENDSISEAAKRLRKALDEKKIETKYVVSAIPPHGVKTYSVNVPVEREDIDSWIRENYEKIVKVSVPFSQLSYGYETLGCQGETNIVEITFVKKPEIHASLSFLHEARLIPLSLSAGLRDAVNVWFVDTSHTKHIKRFVHIHEQGILTASVEKGRKEYRFIPVYENNSDPAEVLDQQGFIKEETIVSGIKTEELSKAGFIAFTPLGLSAEYGLSAGLAIKGFLPEIHPINFLPEERKQEVRASARRGLTRRLILSFGMLCILLLGIPLVISFGLQSKLDSLDAGLSSPDSEFVAVSGLEQQAQEMERTLQESGARGNRTNVARVLHDVAEGSPRSLWLQQLKLANSQQGMIAQVAGYAASNDDVTSFLKGLKKSGMFSDVSLIHSGSQQKDGIILPASMMAHVIIFQIACTIRK